MGSYVPNTPEERQEMLRAIGLHDFRELYGDVPASMYLDRPARSAVRHERGWRCGGP